MNVNVRGVRYHAWIEGDVASEPATLLLHGFTGSGLDWEPLVPRLRALGRATVAVDLLGHGRSEIADDPTRYTMSETVDDLGAILSELGIQSADWIGYSMGGRVALHAALTLRDRVRSLVLESASAGIQDAVARHRRRRSDDALAARIEERGIEWFADYWSTLPLFETQWELPPATLQGLRERRLANDPLGLARSLRGIGQGVQEYVGDRLPSLTIPTLFVAGERDPKYVDLARLGAASVPGAACVIVPGSGHTVHLEAPDAFAEAIASFGRTITASTAAT